MKKNKVPTFFRLSSNWPFIIQSLWAVGNWRSPSPTSINASPTFDRAHSSLADFMKTREVGADSRARPSSLRARANSLFSDSSLTAASQISSELGLALNANDKIDLKNKNLQDERQKIKSI